MAPNDILTSATLVGTVGTTFITSIQAELESPLETTVPHHVLCAKAKSQAGPATKASTCGFRNLIRLTPVQVGLRPIKEQASHSSAHNPNSSDHAHSPTCQQTLSDFSEFLTIQSSTSLTSPCSTTTEPNQELQVPPLSTPNRLPSPSNPLKRKVTEKELNFFAKRLKIVARGPKPIYFDPETVALILQSSLEYFILKER